MRAPRKHLLGLSLCVLLATVGSASAGGRFYTLAILTNSVNANGQNSAPYHISDTGYICGNVPLENAWQSARWNPDGTVVARCLRYQHGCCQ